MGKINSKSYLCNLIKNDNYAQALKVLEKHPEYINEPLNDGKDTPGLILACTYGSNEIIKLFIEKNCDPNIYKTTDKTTALMVAVKSNNFSTCKFLLEKGAEVNLKNDYGLSAFDYSVLYCNYEISLYFKEKYKSNVKEIDYYLEQGNRIGAPLFNIKLYLDCLNQDVSLDKIPQFKLTREQNKDFSNQIPNPNETWNQFFNRIMKFEIFQPPMIDKQKVPLEQRNSLYLKLQSKLLEIEYDQTITLHDQEKDIEKQTDSERGIVNSNNKYDIQLQNIPIKDDNHKKDLNNNQLVILDEETINLQKIKSEQPVVEIPLRL